MIHIIFSASAAGSLRQALPSSGESGRVFDLSSEPHLGPIAPSFSLASSVAREKWLDLKAPLGFGSWDWLARREQKFVDAIEADQDRTIWVAPNSAEERCGLHCYLERFGADNSKFIVVDYGFPGCLQGKQPRNLGELGVEQFRYLLENANRQPWDQARFPRERWTELCKDTTNLRIIENDTLINVPENRFDDVILARCKLQWRKGYRVLAEAMVALWEQQHDADDTLIL